MAGKTKVDMTPYKPEEICEALVRHTEISGSEVFEKNYVVNDTIKATIWCVIGPNAESFRDMVQAWLKDHNFLED